MFQNFTPVQNDEYTNSQFISCIPVFPIFQMTVFLLQCYCFYLKGFSMLGSCFFSAESLPPSCSPFTTPSPGSSPPAQSLCLSSNSPHKYKYGYSHFLPSIPQSTGHETTQPPGSASRANSPHSSPLALLCSTCFSFNDQLSIHLCTSFLIYLLVYLATVLSNKWKIPPLLIHSS